MPWHRTKTGRNVASEGLKHSATSALTIAVCLLEAAGRNHYLEGWDMVCYHRLGKQARVTRDMQSIKY